MCMCVCVQVGVLSSHVHSLVMSSNGMDGRIPAAVADLTHLRMIELATMPGTTCTRPSRIRHPVNPSPTPPPLRET